MLRSVFCAAAASRARAFSTRTRPESTAFRDPVRQVFISQSNDVFTNLALEDWLYRHHDFDHKHLLLLWRNDPCVVIGRHQNPWCESNVPFLRESEINLARRNSGGGTVYHDLGNLNCTFFTRRSKYHRRRNLDVICGAIQESTRLDVSVNERDDIVLEKAHKVSGTAAKLGQRSAYHHCTVLVDVNECVLHDALNSHAACEAVESRATQSVRVPVRSLAEADPTIDVQSLQASIGWRFLRTNVDGLDEGPEAASKQRGFQLVRPDDDWFPGLEKLRQEFASHAWVFGKTPKFKVAKSFDVPPTVSDAISFGNLTFEFEVFNGHIENVRVQLPPGLLDPDLVDISDVLARMPFGHDLVARFANTLSTKDVPEAKKVFLIECVDRMVGNFV